MEVADVADFAGDESDDDDDDGDDDIFVKETEGNGVNGRESSRVWGRGKRASQSTSAKLIDPIIKPKHLCK